MRLASFSLNGAANFGVVTADGMVPLGGPGARFQDLREIIARDGYAELREAAEKKAAAIPLDDVLFEPVIPNPARILCVGLNYESHRLETGRPVVGHPTMFLRLASSQTGHRRPLVRPLASGDFDYEGELVVIIGKGGSYITPERALDHVAGYSIYNEGSVRDWQRHTAQYTPGKNFSRTGAFGPWMVTADEIPDPTSLRLTTRLNGQVMQDAGIDQMIFSIHRIISYCSAFTPLEPGDVIVTGTPGGVGMKRTPPVYMKDGDRVEVEITGIGTLVNMVENERGDEAAFRAWERAYMQTAKTPA